MKAIDNILYAIKEARKISKFMPLFLMSNGVINVIVAFLEIFLIKYVVDYATSDHFRMASLLCYLLGYILFMASVDIFKKILMGMYSRKFEMNLMSYIMSKVYEKSARIDLINYDKRDFYDKMDRVMDRCGLLYWDIWFGCSMCLTRIVVLVFFFSVYHDVWLMLAIVIDTLVNLILEVRLKKRGYSFERQEASFFRYEDYINRVFSENSYAQELRTAVCAKDMLIGKYEKCTRDHQKKYRGYLSRCVSEAEFNTISSCTIHLVVSIYVSYLWLRHTITVGDFLVMITIVSTMSERLLNVLKAFPDLFQASKYVGEVREILDCPTMLDKDGEKVAVVEFEKLEFQNVSFKYREDAIFCIHDLSFSIKQGEIIAIVGLNGGGKSTLADCVMGLLVPDGGRIELNGRDYSEFKMRDIRNLFSIVFQDFQIYELSVAENILMRENCSQEDMELLNEALKYVGLYEKVSAFPKGIHTVLSMEESDSYLSGGELQLLAIARAYARNAPVLLFDEPTSALDVYMTNRFYQKLFGLSKIQKKTILLISHKLKYMDLVDRILYVRDGTISEMGSHEELMKRNKQYAVLYQLRGEELLEGRI